MTKAQIKFIQALSRQKYRKEYNAYLVEGDKNVKEWLNAPDAINQIFGTGDWLKENKELIARHPEAKVHEIADFELAKITSLTHPQQVLIVVEKPEEKTFTAGKDSWCVFLEKVQDPGNMGTIIRTADWFGIEQVLLSPDCVEIYNPKVVQATMGSLLRINFFTLTFNELETIVQQAHIPLYATCLEGRNIFQMHNVNPGIIAMGNESAGLSERILTLSDQKITIPRIGKAESLNVGVAMGIIAANLIQG